jgi:hypothetical protein
MQVLKKQMETTLTQRLKHVYLESKTKGSCFKEAFQLNAYANECISKTT